MSGRLAVDNPAVGPGDWAISAATRRMNHRLAIVLVGVVLTAPVPAASNRPVIWLAWAALLGLVGTVYFLARARSRSRRSSALAVFPEMLPAALIFLGFAAIQTVPLGTSPAISAVPGATVIALARVASSLLFFILFMEIGRRDSRAATVALSLFLGVVAHALWALISLNLLGDNFFWGPKDAYRGMATGTFVNRNAFAMFLGMGSVLGFSIILGRREQGRPAVGPEMVLSALLWLCLGLVLIALVATQSRMGLLATGAGLVVTVILSVGGSRRAVWLLVLLVAVGAALLAVTGAGLVDRLIRIESDGIARGALYGQVLQMIRARPLGGHGLDTFPVAFQLYHTLPVSPDLVWNQAHSAFLGLWCDMGVIIGSIPPVLGLIAMVRMLRATRVKRVGGPGSGLTVAAIAALVVAGLHSTVDFGMEIQANMFLLLSLVALGMTRPGLAGPK